MKIKINKATELSNKILQTIGFSLDDAKLITQNLIEAELVEKKTHGLIRLLSIKRLADQKKINVNGETFKIIKDTPTQLHIDSKNKPGFIVIYKSLDLAIPKAKQSGIVSVGLKDLGYASGYIGAYAKMAAKENLIFIGFNNSPGGLIPYGSKKELWGTDPITVGIPTNDLPVILDMASSKITFGQLIVAKQENKLIPEGVALDKEGNPTTNAIKAIEGGILPIAGHKGSGMAFIVELLAGALTGSRVGYAVPGGWGTFYILIDPTLFRPLKDFKTDVQKAIIELKNAPKAKGFKEILFPGERAARKREENLKSGEIEIGENLYKLLKEIINQ